MAINYTYKPYEEDEETRRRRAALEAAEASKPAAYSGSYASAVDEALRKIQNREKFSYDVNADALYQQYKDSYTRQGKLAMEDTIGKAAALTGGYGNSYAQTAGQQTYQAYLDKLNDRIPELYAAAYDRYRKEGEDLKDEYAMLSARDQQEYARHRDAVDDYYKDISYRRQSYGDAYDRGYGRYSDEQNRLYQLALEAQEQENTDRAFAESKRQYEESKAASAAKLAEDARKADMEYYLAMAKLEDDNKKSDKTVLDPTIDADIEYYVGEKNYYKAIDELSKYYSGLELSKTAKAYGITDFQIKSYQEANKIIENYTTRSRERIDERTVEDGFAALSSLAEGRKMTEDQADSLYDMYFDALENSVSKEFFEKIQAKYKKGKSQQINETHQRKKADDIYMQGQIDNGLWYR